MPMRVRTAGLLLLAFGCIAAAPPPLAVYPAKGQSASRQAKDRSECDRWAVNQTGYDPALAAPPPQQRGGVARGAVGGAVIGGIAGSFSGDAGKGAAVGGLLGGTAGGLRQRNRNAAAVARQDQNLEGYDRALAACLTGRGYTVR